MALHTALFLAVTLAALALSDSCGCNPKTKGYDKCSDNTVASDDRIYKRHNDWELYGDCLPEVEANNMKCFRWRTRTCSNTPDICVYIEREKFNDKIRVLDRSAMLLSPDYTNLVSSEDQSFGRHMFCVYNVSLSCPQNSVIIKSTARTNWPRQQDTSCHHEGGCENYVAFYDDRDSSIISREFYGQKNYTHSLDSDSFLAVMWTNTDRNDGVFEFSAKCNDNPFVSETSTGGGGSGNEEIRPASEDIDN